MKVSGLFFALLIVAVVCTVAFIALYKFSGRFRELVKDCAGHLFCGDGWEEDDE